MFGKTLCMAEFANLLIEITAPNKLSLYGETNNNWSRACSLYDDCRRVF